MKTEQINLNKNQQGMVSIIVTLILMIVITLVVLGFAQISRREQRQALDRQLSTQAFYAAESGVNDAVAAIHNTTTPFTADKNTCDNTATPFTGVVVPGDPNIKYTCLLITQAPQELLYATGEGDSINADLNFVDSTGAPTTADTLVVKWQDSTGGATAYGSYPDLPTRAVWRASTTTPILRMQLTKMTSFARNSMQNNMFTAYLYPSNGAGTITYSPNYDTGVPSPSTLSSQGKIVQSDCSGGWCQVVITIGAADKYREYLMRLGTIYGGTKQISITAFTGGGAGTQLNIKGAQAVIDSTGKAQDVLRRIQVRSPLQALGGVSSGYAVQSVEGLCKQLNIGAVSSYGSCP